MFGYLTVNGRELSAEARTRYEGYYCGLCHALNERFGAQGRVTLSNDMTFLLMLLSSLYEPEETRGTSFCILHPVKKRVVARNALCGYAADMNIMLAYYKCADDWRDDNSAMARLQTKLLKRGFESVERAYPDKCGVVRECLDEIYLIEARDGRDVDALANLTGRFLGEIYAYRRDFWGDQLRAMGEALGRFIYVMDAYDDLQKDIKRGKYNPLRPYLSQEGHEVFFADTLTLLMAECADAFELLPIVRDADILRNILYSGAWARYSLRAQRHKRGHEMARKER